MKHRGTEGAATQQATKWPGKAVLFVVHRLIWYGTSYGKGVGKLTIRRPGEGAETRCITMEKHFSYEVGMIHDDKHAYIVYKGGSPLREAHELRSPSKNMFIGAR